MLFLPSKGMGDIGDQVMVDIEVRIKINDKSKLPKTNPLELDRSSDMKSQQTTWSLRLSRSRL